MSLKRKRNKIVGMATFTVAISFSINAQVPGCTDPLALNFNPSAQINDGSCDFTPQAIVTNTIADYLWTINDSDNEPEVYKIDPYNGDVVATIVIDNATQTDWEGMASDGTFLYIGDFGNNLGSRTDLRIFRVPWLPLMLTDGDTSISAEIIEFSYPDQVDFTPQYHHTDFDCEAMVFHNDSLHLFSKNWVDNKTRHYRLTTNPGSYTAILVDSFDVHGLITDATIDEVNGRVTLLGYTSTLQPFMYLLNEYPIGKPLRGNKRKLLMPDHGFQQTEGVAFDGSLAVYFTREFYLSGPALYHADLTTILFPNGVGQVLSKSISAVRADGSIHVDFEAGLDQRSMIRLHDLQGRQLYMSQLEVGTSRFTLEDQWKNQALLISKLNAEGTITGTIIPVGQ